jgi:hypothetical protein
MAAIVMGPGNRRAEVVSLRAGELAVLGQLRDSLHAEWSKATSQTDVTDV